MIHPILTRMPGMNCTIVVLIYIVMMGEGAKAQSPDSVVSETLHLYITGQVALPSEEFRKVINNSIDNLGIGVSAGLLLSPLGAKSPSPLLLGIDFGYFNYGVDKTPGTSTFPALKTNFNVITWSGLLRLRPTNHRTGFTPFLDGLLGVKILNTVTKIDKDLSNVLLNTDQPEVLNRVNNTGLNFGLGAGFYINSKKSDFMGFTLRLLYVWGDDIKYVVRNSIVVDSNGFITYQTSTANTSIIMLQLGLNFNNSKNVKSRVQ